MMPMETLTRKGKEFVLVPVKDLKKLLADADMLADVRAYDAVRGRLARGEDEIIPFALVERRLAGESPVKLWRQHRKLTQEALAKRSGVSRGMIAAIEAGHKKGTVAMFKKLAHALDVSLDQIT